ncbi:MAG: amidohydrolase family protein, partial [Melioribacteraceae bacterium]|nr:amidohydrolase family protein [Melioribacteraceae bacterium]
MNDEIKILKNVFLCVTSNILTPVNIYFDKSIKRIERLSDIDVSWEEIDETHKREKIISNIETKKFPSESKIYDGQFKLVIPGAIDPHVHFDTPGFEFRDTFEHGTTAAAYGGVTTVIDMPCTSLPPVTSVSNLVTKQEAIRNMALVDYAFWGGVCGNDFENTQSLEKNIYELNEAGVASYKAYLMSGMETFKDLTFNQMKWAAEKITETGKPLGVHAEDKNLIESRRSIFKSNNENNWEYYCKARDVFAEEAAVNDMVAIAAATGARVHIVHLSSKAGLEIIEKARRNGLAVSSETCPHYLHFTQNDFTKSEIRNFLKTAPPVKHSEDLNALWEGLSDGSLLFVTTDHAGCDPKEEKISDNFWEVYGGIPGVEHRVPYIFSEGFHKGK